ncbi:alpha/beta hydrolase [Planococcus maritimus]|nr:alpha/beta hydrolase [Planococcus sp. SK3692]MDE4086578.1 alpha/beta hydrolase [Planococcus maritimus]
MNQILFIHSAGPQDEQEGSSGLLQYLKQQLDAEFQIIAPKMPQPEDPHYAPWKQVLKKEIESLSDDAIVVTHSLGGSVLFKFLSEQTPRKPFAKIIAVAAPYWEINSQWAIEEFLLEENFGSRITPLPEVVLFHSAGDPVVPFSHSQKYSEKLSNTTLRKLAGNDHLFSNGIRELVSEIRETKSGY